MIYLYIRHHVYDYAIWKEVFDAHRPAREAGGATGEICVLRSVNNMNEITVILGWNDLNTARAFAQSVSYKVFVQRAGIVNLSEILFLEPIAKL